MCEFCKDILCLDTDIAIARNAGDDFIYKADGEYGLYLSTAEYCHPGILAYIEFCPMCGRELSEV
jgi:hypothetical protein